ncbi:uncharacterized protein LOC143583229 [Bidens hawaiensis]|uniref:uncharacterized protein LOC143583229 n=1 Tax=Bidens hawaiensis TaxID=980011 RepID=UPI004049D30B
MADSGLVFLRDINVSLLTKRWWRFKNEKGKLWWNVIWSFHHSAKPLCYIPTKLSCAGPWRQIGKISPDLNSDGFVLNKLFRTNVKNGETNWFWLDMWVNDYPLCNRFPNLFSIEKSKWCVVADRLYMIDGVICRRWDWQRDPTSLPYFEEFRGLLSICKHVIIRPGKDKSIWCGDHSGEFSVRSLKGLLLEMSLSRPDNVFEWNNWLPKKVGFVAWRVVLNRLPTMEALAKRNILVSSLDCSICGKRMETVDHVFISCDFSQAVWCLISQ